MNPLRWSLVFASCCLGAVALSGDTDDGLKKLQGQWILEKSEKNGAGRWSLSEDALYIEKDLLRFIKKSGELIYNGDWAKITIDPSKNPPTIDLQRRNQPNLILGIYKIEGDQFIIATNTMKPEQRPTKFSTNLAAGAGRATNLQIYKRVSTAGLEKPPAKKKLEQAELDKANAAALKSLQGHWLFEKSEHNGHSYWVLSEEALYIEKNIVRHVKKNGDLLFNGDACEITVDASHSWTAIDLVRRNGNRGQKVLGIFKVEGDKLILAMNTSDDLKDLRPSYFTSKLIAGPERAAIVQVYKRAPGAAAETPPKKDKLTVAQLDALNAEILKKLEGHWIFEKSERNGFSYWVLPEDSFYIEKNLLRRAKKNGDLVFNGDAATIKVDASGPHVAIDLVRTNGNRGQKILGILRFEGDKLILATNTSDDLADRRPGQFTTRLTAGSERAAIVQTYVRAGKP